MVRWRVRAIKLTKQNIVVGRRPGGRDEGSDIQLLHKTMVQQMSIGLKKIALSIW